MLRFLGFELDQQKAELRGPDGAIIRVRLRSLEMLKVFATNPGRVIGKEELMAAVWPGINIGEDSLFQSIREIRTALGDEQRQIIRLMSGRGYLFAAEVSGGTDASVEAGSAIKTEVAPLPGARVFGMRRRAVLIAAAVLGVVTLAAGVWVSRFGSASPATVSVLPMAAPADDALAARMAAGVTRDLTDGLAKIETIRVLVPSEAAQSVDYVVSSELEKTETAWNLRARMTETSTGAVKWTASLSIERVGIDAPLQQARLTASMGHSLAQRLNALLKASPRGADGAPTGAVKVAIEQATASINHTTPERFRAALAILEKTLVDNPDSADLQVALVAFQLRGVQMVWFPAAEREALENSVGTIVAGALRARPDYIPVLQAQCRFLAVAHRFAESLVACGRALTHNPWDGTALYLIGLSHIFLGRFDDALASFKQAERFDTPGFARWTWTLGAGWTYLLTERAEEAVSWLQRSIAVTPGSGRTHMLLAAAYQQLGRADDARATMAAALELRPGSTAHNAPPPTKNNSAVYLKASERVVNLMVAAGLPE